MIELKMRWNVKVENNSFRCMKIQDFQTFTWEEKYGKINQGSKE